VPSACPNEVKTMDIERQVGKLLWIRGKARHGLGAVSCRTAPAADSGRRAISVPLALAPGGL